jgi:methanogenic corrinoid protein MtbC1
MSELIKKLLEAVELGKVDKAAPFPPQLKDQDGASELTKEALETGVSPNDILSNALIPAMDSVGTRFSENKIFVPQMLMSAKAMGAAMFHLKPFFTSGELESKGTFIMGTVKGDLHDIGKNLVIMMVEGSGWTVIDLGVDVPSEKYIEAIKENEGAVVGMSALLTTTMVSMRDIVSDIREECGNDVKICVGGAPVTDEFCKDIGADLYSIDPQGLVEYLKGYSA